jgi:MFS family permease
MSNKSSSSTWAITLFCFGVLMAALDNGIISAALTTINSSFDVSANWGAWGVTIYTLGLAISIPIVGKISDRYGRKKLFIGSFCWQIRFNWNDSFISSRSEYHVWSNKH